MATKLELQIAIKRILELNSGDIDYNFQELQRVLKAILDWINSQP